MILDEASLDFIDFYVKNKISQNLKIILIDNHIINATFQAFEGCFVSF